MESKWLTACAAAQHQAFPTLAPETAGTTIRANLFCGLAGSAFRIVLGEKYSTRATSYGRIMAGVNGAVLPVLFGGAGQVTVESGMVVYSDAVEQPVESGDMVTLWLYNSGDVTSTSCCLLQQAHSEPGDFCGQDFAPVPFEVTMPDGTSAEEELAGVVGLQVRVPAETDEGAIIAFGDSITKMGYWTGPLREEIHKAAVGRTLLNCGVGGNRLLRDTHFPMAPDLQMFGRAGLARMQWDLLDHPGVRAVLLALGTNDISQPGANPMSPPAAERCTLDELIQGYREFIAAAHNAGIKVIGCTITPFGGYTSFNEETEALRVAANEWILNAGEFDATIDFAAAVCQPEQPAYLQETYDSGDHLHPGPAGGAAMAGAIDVDKLLELAR